MSSAEQFEAIVCQHYEALFRFAMSLTRMESDAQDLTQQTFYVWATKGHQLRDVSKVKTWLFTTLHRGFLETRRRKIRFPHQDLDEVSDQLPAFSPRLAEQVDSSQVVSALGRVDEVYQAAVALFYLDDCSYKDIASILGVPIGTVKSRIARGIMQLRGILGLVEFETASESASLQTNAEPSKSNSAGDTLGGKTTFAAGGSCSFPITDGSLVPSSINDLQGTQLPRESSNQIQSPGSKPS